MGQAVRQPKTWREKYLICLKEQLTIVDIKYLREASSDTALDIRSKAIEYMRKEFKGENFIEPKTKVNTEAVFAVTGHDEEYYYKKMLAERKALA